MKKRTGLFFLSLGVFLFFPPRADAQWIRVRDHLGYPSCLFVNGPDVLVGVRSSSDYGGAVLKLKDNGKSWEAIDKNGWAAGGRTIKPRDVECFAVSGACLFAGTDGLGVFLSRDGGVSWTAANSGLPEFTIYFLRVNGPKIYAVGVDYIFLSANNGASWTKVNAGLPNIKIFDLAVSGPNIIVGTQDRGAFLSKDDGTSWTAANTGLPADASVAHLAVSGAFVLASTYSQVYRSADNGVSWVEVQGLPGHTGVFCFEVNGPSVFIGTSGGGVFQSKDNGKNWTAVNQGWLPAKIDVTNLAATDTQLYAAVLRADNLPDELWRMPLGAGGAPSSQPTAQEFIGNGDRAFNDGDYANAILFYSRVIKLEPKSVHAWFRRALSSLYLGGRSDCESALADANRVLELSPTEKGVYPVRGDICLRLAQLASNNKNAKEAEDYANRALADYRIALEGDPGSRVIPLLMADARAAKGDLDGALADFSVLLEKDPKGLDQEIKKHLDRLFETYDTMKREIDCRGFKRTWCLAGDFQERKKHYDQAIMCYSKALELGLTDSWLYSSRALAFKLAGKLVEAISDVTVCIKLNPPAHYWYSFRAELYRYTGELDKAIADYTIAIKLVRKAVKETETARTSFIECYLNRASVFEAKQDWSHAIEDYRTASDNLIFSPPKAYCLYRMGLAYQRKGDAKNAEKYIQQAVAMDPDVKKARRKP